MPSNIVNLGDLVPGLEGKTFRLPQGEDSNGNARYLDLHVPGDLDSETVFGFLALFEEMVAAQERMGEMQAKVAAGDAQVTDGLRLASEEMEKLTASIKERLLAVFQLANPDLKALPFGQATTMAVLGEILKMMGLAEPVDLPEPPGPPTPRRKPQDRRKKVTRSPARK